MGHNTVKGNYEQLVKRLNQFPQGVPPSETLYNILRIMFDEEEAKLVSQLPIRPFTIKKASRVWKKDEKETRQILNKLASRALLIDVDIDGNPTYSLPPPMAGFFEFSLMRVGGNLDQKILSELFYQYINVEDEFITELMTLPTPVGRAFVHEETITDHTLYVLDYEKASHVIKTASHIGVGTCYCRHKKEHTGEVCDAPMDICMTFNATAESLIKHGYAREVSEDECLHLLDTAKEHNLVQFGENVQEDVAFICNCCSCCCEALIGARKVGATQAINTSSYIANIKQTECIGCAKCVDVCPVEAITLVSANDTKKHKRLAQIIVDNCIGCGVCEHNCPTHAIKMHQRDKRVFTPVDLTHRVVLEAIETNKLQNLIFDHQAHLHHRVLASILGVILKLPVIKQVLASDQVKSKYLTTLIERQRQKHQD